MSESIRVVRTVAIDLLPRFQTTSMSAEAMNLNTTVKNNWNAIMMASSLLFALEV